MASIISYVETPTLSFARASRHRIANRYERSMTPDSARRENILWNISSPLIWYFS
jgi:hypothetical protein